jgi:hypothetical protein
MNAPQETYAARLDVDYPDRELNRVTTAFRIIWVIPIFIILALVGGASGSTDWDFGDRNGAGGIGGSIAGGLFLATVLMILFRQVYPRWWFEFLLELERFSARVMAYLTLLTDVYPSTTEHQSVRLDIDYPNVQQDLNRWLALVKWLLAIPHYIVLVLLIVAAVFCVIFAWFAILFTGRYPQGLFDFVVGVGRWGLRVNAYAFLLVTDRYPPFSLK